MIVTLPMNFALTVTFPALLTVTELLLDLYVGVPFLIFTPRSKDCAFVEYVLVKLFAVIVLAIFLIVNSLVTDPV